MHEKHTSSITPVSHPLCVCKGFTVNCKQIVDGQVFLLWLFFHTYILTHKALAPF